MIKLNTIIVNQFKNIRCADIILNDINVITGPSNSGKTNFLQVFSFLNFIINGDEKEVELFFEKGEVPGIGVIVNFQIKDTGTITIKLAFSDTLTKNEWSYSLVISWAKGMKDFIKEESLFYKKKESANDLMPVFTRDNKTLHWGNETMITMPEALLTPDMSVIRLIKKHREIFVPDESIVSAIEALDAVITNPVYYFADKRLKNHGESALIENSSLRGLLTDNTLARLEKSKKNWHVFKKMLHQLLNISDVEVHHIDNGKNNFHAFSIFKLGGQDIFLNQLEEESVILIDLLTRILLAETPIFILEEPEKSIHPQIFQAIMEHFGSSENERQFIITTHSVPFINAVLPENILIATAGQDGLSEIGNLNRMLETKNKTNENKLNFGQDIFLNLDSATEN